MSNLLVIISKAFAPQKHRIVTYRLRAMAVLKDGSNEGIMN